MATLLRSKKPNNISFAVNDDDLAKLDQLVRAYGSETRSHLIRRLIRQAGVGQGTL